MLGILWRTKPSLPPPAQKRPEKATPATDAAATFLPGLPDPNYRAHEEKLHQACWLTPNQCSLYSAATVLLFSVRVRAQPPAGVTYSYQLTPLGVPMPGLFVSEEISTRRSGGGKGGGGEGGSGGRSTSTSTGSGSGSGGSGSSLVKRRKSTGGSVSSAGEKVCHSPPSPSSSSLSSFTVRGGKPRSTVCWTVTTVVLQESPRSPSVGGASEDGEDRRLRVSSPAPSSEGASGEGPVGGESIASGRGGR